MKYNKKWWPFSIAVTAILLTFNSAQAQTIKLLKSSTLSYYPSASAVEWYNGRLYVMGDDAPNVLMLRKKHNKPDSIRVFPSNEKRIHYSVKPDIESATLWRSNGRSYLLLIPSFSAPQRNKLAFINLQQGNQLHLQENTLHGKGPLKEINIEGAATVDEQILFANRGNLSTPQNHLIPANFDTTNGIFNWQPPIPMLLPKTAQFAGVSGLCYIAEKDMLLFTASTEMTESANADGAIGDSYVGIVYNLKKQLTSREIVADTLINLTPILKSKLAQKIESVTAESIRGRRIKIHLAADNDNGESSLFRLKLQLQH